MPLPCIEVSQLAPSTSFYAAVLQPLGIRYLTSESVASGPDFATFGCCQGPVLHLRQIAQPTALRLSSIRLSAPSPAAILAFHRQGMEANPGSIFTANSPVNHSAIFDPDGNMMQAVCTGHVCRPDMITGQYALVLNPQQETPLCHILDRNSSTPEPSTAPVVERGGSTKDASENRNSPEGVDSIQRETGKASTPNSGMSTVLSTLIGVAAGAAAGAAITYGVMSAKTPQLVPTQMIARQGSLANDTNSISPELVDRDPQTPIPLRSHRITFQEDQPSTVRKPPTLPPASTCPPASIRPPASVRPPASTCPPASVRPPASTCPPASVRPPASTCPPASVRPPTSVHESNVLQTRSNYTGDGQEDKGKELVKIYSDAGLPPSKPSSTVSTRQLTLPPPASPSSETQTSVAKGPSPRKDHETVVSAHSRVPSSSTTPAQVSTRSSELLTTVASSVSKRAPRDAPSKHDFHLRSIDNKSSVSERLPEPRSRGMPSPQPRSITEVSQRSSSSAPGRSDMSEVSEARGHASARKSDVSASRHHNSDDKRSHVSAKNIPLPESRCTSEFFDTESHTSDKTVSAIRHHNSDDKRSHVSAKNIPLPESRCTSEFFDTQSHASDKTVSAHRHHSSDDKCSHVSAKNIPLPTSRCSSEFFDIESNASKKTVSTAHHHSSGDDKGSHVSAKNIPLPVSRCTSEFYDTRSHASARKTNVPASGHHRNDDQRSHISAKSVPLPASRCTSDFDAQSSTRKASSSATCPHSGDDKRSHVSARNVPLPASQAGNSEFFDTQSHTSARKTDVPASRNHDSEDKRSRVSARDVPLPSSRVGASGEFFDSVTHISARETDVSARKSDVSTGRHQNDDKRSRVSARDVPLPSSRIGTSEFFDTVSHASTIKARSSASRKDIAGVGDSQSRVSAKNIPLPASRVGNRNSQVSAQNIPLPASCVGTNYHNGPPSHISAKNVPLPGSHIGSSRANWDDDLRSVAPSDSISCVGAK